MDSSSKDTAHHALLAGKFCFLSDHNAKVNWLIDNGATNHICNSLTEFTSFKAVTGPEFITIPDGKQVDVKHMGTVQLTKDIILHNVLHVQDFHFNLIYVQRLCKDLSCAILFNVDKCVLQDLSQKQSQMPFGEISGGLYSTNKIQVAASSRSCHVAVTNAKVWHLRLGHIPFSRLKILLPHIDVSNIDFVCQVCPKAKQVKSSFTHSYIKTKSCFEMIHIDVWGPYKIKSSSGCTQFLTIVDDFSRFTWVHLIKQKSECVNVLANFFSISRISLKQL